MRKEYISLSKFRKEYDPDLKSIINSTWKTALDEVLSILENNVDYKQIGTPRGPLDVEDYSEQVYHKDVLEEIKKLYK